jgi:glutathione S-transferase
VTTARLHHFRISHFNEKVRWTLDFKKVPHRRNAFMPGMHLGAAKKLSGKTQLPILELDREVLTGSANILAELEMRYPEPPLYPTAPADRERAKALEAHFDDNVAAPLRTLFWWAYLKNNKLAARMIADGKSIVKRAMFRGLLVLPMIHRKFSDNIGLDAERVRVAREGLVGYFDRVEREIQPSGFLVGDRFTIADLAVASIMAALVRPPEFSYPLPEPKSPEFVELQDLVRSHAGFRWVEGIYTRHRGVSSEVT